MERAWRPTLDGAQKTIDLSNLNFWYWINWHWYLIQFSALALRVKVQGHKVQKKRGQSISFLICCILHALWSNFFQRCHSSGFEDIPLFHLDLLPYLDGDVSKSDFLGAIFLVIVAVLLCCRELRTGVTSYLINFSMILNCITKPHACSQIYLH